MRARWLTSFATGCLLLAGCGTSYVPADQSSDEQRFPDDPRTEFGGERPVTLQVPSSYDAGRPTPLLIILHGYGADGFYQQGYLRLGDIAETRGILAIAPDGTLDRNRSRFWNATNACCDFSRSNVDDVAYLRGLIAEIRKDYNVDAKRIYLIGHSNGGFMAHRMACEAAAEIAAIISLAGATFDDPDQCRPSEPVSILNIHGDADDTIAYEGGIAGGGVYPSAAQTMEHWRQYNRCSGELIGDATRLDLDRNVVGLDTDVQRFGGCTRGSGVELWSIRGGSHIPTFTRPFADLIWQWLSDHPKL